MQSPSQRRFDVAATCDKLPYDLLCMRRQVNAPRRDPHTLRFELNPQRPVRSQRDLQNRAHHILGRLPIQAGLLSIQQEFPARIVEVGDSRLMVTA
jgi:hypothetical protein